MCCVALYSFPISLVSVPPTITPFFFEEGVVLHDQVTLQCDAKGDLPMILSWSYHHHHSNTSGSTPQKNDIRTMKLSERTSVLIIDSIGSHHLGFYTCTARSGPANLSANYTTELESVKGGLVVSPAEFWNLRHYCQKLQNPACLLLSSSCLLSIRLSLSLIHQPFVLPLSTPTDLGIPV